MNAQASKEAVRFLVRTGGEPEPSSDGGIWATPCSAPPTPRRRLAHVLLFVTFTDATRTRAQVIEAGAWDGRAWKVVESEYALEALARRRD